MPEHKIKRERSSSYSTDKKKKRHEKRSHSRSRSRSHSAKKHKSHKSRRDEKRKSQERSRSKQHAHRHRSEKSEERQREQLEQRIRIAMRTGTYQKDPEIQMIASNFPPEKLQTLHQQAMRPSQINEPILVRQLFISGLIDMNDKVVINEIMEGYGLIQSIEICKNFTFVKFFKVEDASSACADYHNINLRLHSVQNPNFKMFFADHLKRWNVVSNNIEYEVKQHLIPVVYASIRPDPKIANEQYLHSIFSKYGSIRNLALKQNQSPGPKVYALVEFETIQQALKAREKLSNNKQKLGDRRSQVTILLDTVKVTRTYANVANQLRYQRQNSKRVQQPHIPSITQTNYNSMNIESNPFESADQGLYDIIMKFASSDVPQQQPQEEPDWSGFLTRNKIFRVGVDFKFTTKTHLEFQFVLNVSHRADMEDGLRREAPLAVGKFKASNQMNQNGFNDYIKYFQRKNRAGIVQTPKYLIYLIPPNCGVAHHYEIAPNQLLALFFKIGS